MQFRDIHFGSPSFHNKQDAVVGASADIFFLTGIIGRSQIANAASRPEDVVAVKTVA
jgi:hypothetical protein